MSQLLYLKNVVTLRLDPAKCVGCGMCLDVCPRAVFARSDGKVAIAFRDACIECGACQQNCAAGALSVRAGVGCAHAIINAALGRTSADCCCIVETRESDNPPAPCGTPDRTSCC